MSGKTLGFAEPPFSNTPDPKFLYPADAHQQALHILYRGILARKGFFTLTGDVGTGKTTLCRALLKKLDGEVDTALVLNPDLSQEEILRLILKDFGLTPGRAAKSDLMELLYEYLVERARMGRSALIIIDDAQNLPERSLEQIRMISNFETEKEKLVQILLVGQQEMNDTLARHSLRQVRQRIAVRAHLRPLTEMETADYVVHRLRVAGGGKVKTSFSSRGLKDIFRETGGYPRSVNTLCDHLLIAARRAGLNSIGHEMVRETARAMRPARTWRSRLSLHKNALRWSAAAAALAILTVAALFTSTALRTERASEGPPLAAWDGRLSNMEKSLAMLEKELDDSGGPDQEFSLQAQEALEEQLLAARKESESFRRLLREKAREFETLDRELKALREHDRKTGNDTAGQSPAGVQGGDRELERTIEVLKKENQIKEERVNGIEKALDVLRRKLHETLREREELARALDAKKEPVPPVQDAASAVENLILMEQLKQENTRLKEDQRQAESLASQTIRTQGEEIKRLTLEKQKLMEAVEEKGTHAAGDSRETTSLVSIPTP